MTFYWALLVFSLLVTAVTFIPWRNPKISRRDKRFVYWIYRLWAIAGMALAVVRIWG